MQIFYKKINFYYFFFKLHQIEVQFNDKKPLQFLFLPFLFYVKKVFILNVNFFCQI